MNILDEIFEFKRANQVSRAELNEWVAKAKDQAPALGFRRTLADSKNHPSLIAEIKKASPVKGVIREDFDPALIAKIYREVGVDCMSVLTCTEFFQGSPENLIRAKAIAGLPVIRKDFTVCEGDVFAARAMGADAVLLIVYGLSDPELRAFRELAESMGMDALVEVHGTEELERALASGATFIGVNNRDLRTFETRIETTEEVALNLPEGVHLVSESALRDSTDIQRVKAAGARSVLIGTSFMTAPNIGAKVREVMGW